MGPVSLLAANRLWYGLRKIRDSGLMLGETSKQVPTRLASLTTTSRSSVGGLPCDNLGAARDSLDGFSDSLHRDQIGMDVQALSMASDPWHSKAADYV